jgi:hypothetical protein
MTVGALFVTMLVITSMPQAQAPEPPIARLKTQWTDRVSRRLPHPEYPRPQFARPTWQNLNGLWDYAIRPQGAARPAEFDGKILVPFPVESYLSGVGRTVGPKHSLWYRRKFQIPRPWRGRVILHFGAVDWEARVWLNGTELGVHRGGYDSFHFDITDYLDPGRDQELILEVRDPSDASWQPRGKQVVAPKGIFYTPTTGIWQTVWLEPVPERHIVSMHIVPDPDSGRVELRLNTRATPGDTVSVRVMDGTTTIVDSRANAGDKVTFKVGSPRLWSPGSPFLYTLLVSLDDSSGGTMDTVSSYFGFRKVEVRKDQAGITRLFLNGEPYFMFGPLDQGFWPDGLYTAPTDAALRYDIEFTKRLGFNLIRKHVKVEPERWYYWCDRLGILVWQDMPSGDRFIGGSDPDIVRTEESKNQFELELRRMIEMGRNHPCIVAWVPFNEGWGQFDTARIAKWVKDFDPTRLVNSASGWTDRNVGDMLDWHAYPGPASPAPEERRAAVLGEFGGLGLPIPGHMWQRDGWGYQSYRTQRELTDAFVALLSRLRLLRGDPGLSAAVYTQTTDVETEVNGLLTYDRAVVKVDERAAREAIRRVFAPPPTLVPILPTSQAKPVQWRYTIEQPAEGWEGAVFDDSGWRSGTGGFGVEGTPGAVVRTRWSSGAIWLRRRFSLPAGPRPRMPHLLIHHDEDCQVYLDGIRIAELSGYTTSYVLVPLDASAKALLTPGEHVLAVTCRQTTGGQYIDVGIVDVEERT